MSRNQEAHKVDSIAKKQKLDSALTIGDADMRVTRQRAAMEKGFDASASSPFNELPDEILEHVFTFLDHKSLLNSTLVDKRFCYVIVMSSIIMKNLPLRVELYRKQEKLRCYSSIELYAYRKPIPKRITKVLETISQHVKIVELWCYNEADFCEIMKLLPNTEILALKSHIFFREPQPFVNIKTLINKTYSSSSIINSYSMFPNLKHLHVREFYSYPNISIEEIKTAASKMEHLESLTVTGDCYGFNNPVGERTETRIYDFIRCGTLKTLNKLTLKNLNASELIGWKNVIENHPKLREIDVDIFRNEQIFDFNELITNARPGSELKIRGAFRMTEERLRQFKKNSSRGVRLNVSKQSLTMNEEDFEEIMGEQKQMIEFIA